MENMQRYANRVLDLLVDCGPLTKAEACAKLDWPETRFSAAVKYARERLCEPLGLTIPAPTPSRGWVYQVTTEWEPVHEGTSWTMGLVETRLAAMARDVDTVLPHLEKGSVDWRRANFLSKHLNNIVGTMREIV